MRAALTCLAAGRDVWRRLVVIAFEDVGAGSEDVVSEVVEAIEARKRSRRSKHDLGLLAHLVHRLAEAPKDRSSDYLICAAQQHGSLSDMRDICGPAPQSERLRLVGDRDLTLPARATAAWYASGLGWSFKVEREREQLEALADCFLTMGTSERLVRGMRAAGRLIREPIVALVPLIQLEVRSGPVRTVVDPLPECLHFDGVPSYALDKHTRLGQSALQQLLSTNEGIQACLQEFVPEYRWRDAVFMASFYTDGTPVKLRLDWPQSLTLMALGTEVDFAKAGIPSNGVAAVSKAMAEALTDLNLIRAKVWSDSIHEDRHPSSLPNGAEPHGR